MQDHRPDRTLIRRLKEREASAVADLESAYRAKIYQLAFRYMRNHEDAEEVTQDVLLRVHDKIDAFRGDAALSSWIYRITFNAAMSRLRSPKFKRSLEVPHVELHTGPDDGREAVPQRSLADWSSLADDAVHRAELRARLVTALAQLPDIYRLPVVLRDVRGLSTAEASGVLKLKPQTLKSRLHRGRLILREQLAEFSDGLALRRPAA